MNKYSLIALTAACLLLSPAAHAEDLARFPTGPAQWKVKISPSPDSTFVQENPEVASAFPLKEIEVVQDARKFRHTATYQDGTSRESWGLTGLKQILTEDPNGTVFFSNGKLSFDRGDLDWIKRKHLQDKEPVTYEDRDCYHYKASFKDYDEQGKYLGTRIYQAWLDSETQRPVAFDNGVELGVYEFLPPPRDRLVISPQFRQPLENRLRVMGQYKPREK